MAHTLSSCVLLALLVMVFTSYLAIAEQHNVLSYGAKPDGRTDSTKAFLAAWAQACSSISPSTIYVPPGRFFLQNVEFKGPCKNKAIVVRIDGTLLAPTDYRIIGNAGNWIFFQNVDGVTVSGGVLDGHGSGLWDCKQSGKNCPSGATTLGFSNSNNIVISGLTSLNSQMFHIVINGCNSVKIQGVRVTASGNSPNTDGIHVQLSSNITILSSKIGTGDDCVSIGAGTTNLWIENVVCGPGHGISIGSLGKDLNEPGVQNASGVKISDVIYQDIQGTSATQVAVRFDCSKKFPCTGIKMEDVKLTYKNQPAGASCNNADGTTSGVIQPNSCLYKALKCVTALLEGEYGALYADLEEPEGDHRISPLHGAAATGFVLVLKWFELLLCRKATNGFENLVFRITIS
ncbi:hypothetical protein POTOM_037086 [Populus tomentosa]|uniref:Polygalacturonase-like n=1 Tax=Populus tomentosa TaxID=118781 RepID=A0A8X7Z5I2_POPTO|nr:hypothetical protein POTOM_037086 [Populus tomentosa]